MSDITNSPDFQRVQSGLREKGWVLEAERTHLSGKEEIRFFKEITIGGKKRKITVNADPSLFHRGMSNISVRKMIDIISKTETEAIKTKFKSSEKERHFILKESNGKLQVKILEGKISIERIPEEDFLNTVNDFCLRLNSLQNNPYLANIAEEVTRSYKERFDQLAAQIKPGNYLEVNPSKVKMIVNELDRLKQTIESNKGVFSMAGAGQSEEITNPHALAILKTIENLKADWKLLEQMHELASSEKTLVAGSWETYFNYQQLSQKLPNDRFLKVFVNQLHITSKAIESYEKKLTSIIENKELSIEQKLDKIGLLYQSTEFSNYTAALIEQNVYYLLFSKKEPFYRTEFQKNDMRAFNPEFDFKSRNHPIIYVQRMPRHQMLMQELCKRSHAEEGSNIQKGYDAVLQLGQKLNNEQVFSDHLVKLSQPPPKDKEEEQKIVERFFQFLKDLFTIRIFTKIKTLYDLMDINHYRKSLDYLDTWVGDSLKKISRLAKFSTKETSPKDLAPHELFKIILKHKQDAKSFTSFVLEHVSSEHIRAHLEVKLNEKSDSFFKTNPSIQTQLSELQNKCSPKEFFAILLDGISLSTLQKEVKRINPPKEDYLSEIEATAQFEEAKLKIYQKYLELYLKFINAVQAVETDASKKTILSDLRESCSKVETALKNRH